MQISADVGNTVTVGASVAMAAVRSLVFIDPGIDQWQGLVAKLRGAPRLVLLDPDLDGVWQISQVLAGCRDLVAVHILAHGVPGCLRLGSTNLSLATLYRHAEQVAGWRVALGPRAEILIYTSEVEADADGEALLRRLGELTGAALTLSPLQPAKQAREAKAKFFRHPRMSLAGGKTSEMDSRQRPAGMTE